MKKFKFVGAPGEKLHLEDVEHHAFGLDFSGGVVVEVKDKAFIEKLANNCHYEEVKESGGKPPSHMNKDELSEHAATLGLTLTGETKAEMRESLNAQIKAREDGENNN